MLKTVVLFALLLGMPSGQETPPKPKFVSNGFMKAGEFLDLGQEVKVGFAMGFVDGMDAAPFFDAPDDNKIYARFRTCTTDMSAKQVAAILEKYIRDNPEEWHVQLNTVAFNGILKACPI